jgi:hypothetical protein
VPRQIRYTTNDDEITTVTWSNSKTDKTIKKKTFELEPAGDDWDIEITPLEEPEPK